MIEVVAALISNEGSILICQRPAEKARPLYWEFVGGKVDPGESHEEALARECREELGVDILVGGKVIDVSYDYPDVSIHLHLYSSQIASGSPQALEHNDIKWIRANEIFDYSFCPADTLILEAVRDFLNENGC